MAGVTGCVRQEQPIVTDPRPALIGHRGCAGEYTENTVTAVEAAAAVADAVEVDVRQCQSGELIVFHDDRLDRLTRESGPVSQTPCDLLVDLEVRDSGDTIPTLDEIFGAVPPEIKLVLDLKEPGLIDDILTLHEAYGHDILVSSFHESILNSVYETDSTVPMAYITGETTEMQSFRPNLPSSPSWQYVSNDISGLIDRTVALGCEAIHPPYELCLRTDLVARAHAAGLRVEPWTISTQEEFMELWEVGVDAVISDICEGLFDEL